MVVRAVPAASSLDEFVRLARDAGWTVPAIIMPMASASSAQTSWPA